MARRIRQRSFFLQERRREAGWPSAAAFAEEMGFNKGTYTGYEQGRHMPDVLTLLEIASRLGCAVEDFFTPSRSGTPTAPGTLTVPDTGSPDPLEAELLEHFGNLDDEAKRQVVALATAADRSAGAERFAGLPELATYWQALADEMKATGPKAGTTGRGGPGADIAVSA